MVAQNPKYPVPDRSDFNPNEYTKDPQMREWDLGSFSGLLAGDRPFVAENWNLEPSCSTSWRSGSSFRRSNSNDRVTSRLSAKRKRSGILW